MVTRGTTRRRGGFALLLALVVLAVTLAAAALIGVSLRLRTSELRQQGAMVHLQAISDAGMAYALNGIALSPAWPGVDGEPIDGGSFTVTVRASGTPGWLLVTVEASYRGRRRVVEAAVQPDNPPRVGAWRRVPVAR